MREKLFNNEVKDNSKVKVAIAALAAGSIFGLAGCGGGEETPKNSDNSSEVASGNEDFSNVEVLAGVECAAIPESITYLRSNLGGNTNDPTNYRGEHMDGLKDNIVSRIEMSLQGDDRDMHIMLSEEQQYQLEESTDIYVDETFGGDIPATNEEDSYYDITYKIYDKDHEPAVKVDFQEVEFNTTFENPDQVYAKNVSYCIADVNIY